MPEIGKNVHFTKMHGAGNDYIYINAMQEVPNDLPALSHLISDRHFGVGSDGLVAIMPSEIADFRMRMFNADGSEAEMCGNASRCIGKYVYEKGLTDKTEVSLETLAGIKILKLNVKDGIVESVTVNMGSPEYNSEPIAVELGNGKRFELIEVNMGNPHAVIFTDDLTDENVHGNGSELEVHPVFPNKSNIEFVDIISRNEVRMRVWERGSGETLACGTGACAVAVAAVVSGLADRCVTLHLPGGDLQVEWDGISGNLFLTGPAEFVADGVYYIPEAKKDEGGLLNNRDSN